MNLRTLKTQRLQFGMSLIELLVSMVVGIFVIGGITQVFMTTKHSNEMLVAETELQENARLAFSIITTIVQKSGNFGCKASTDTNTTSLLNFDEDTFRPWVAIEGWEAANTDFGKSYNSLAGHPVLKTPNTHWRSADNAVLDANITAVRNSDILKIWHTSNDSASLTSATADKLVFSGLEIEAGDVAVINDCKTVTFIQACSCESFSGSACSSADVSPTACSSPGNKTFNPSTINIATANIETLKQTVFFVGKTSQDSRPSLFTRSLGNNGKIGAREEVLEGLESMQIHYGEDTSGNNSPNYYVASNNVKDWRNVVSIRLSLLMRSNKDKLLSKPQNVLFNGSKIKVAANDTYLRRVFSSTISLRNRNIGY